MNGRIKLQVFVARTMRWKTAWCIPETLSRNVRQLQDADLIVRTPALLCDTSFFDNNHVFGP